MNCYFVSAILFMSACSTIVAQELPLAHMVYFTLKNDSPAHRQQLIEACDKHLHNHEGTVYFSVGTIAEELARDVNDRQFDVALHIVFANKQAHDTYQTHPRHLKFIEENKQLWSQVRVFDSYVTAAPRSSIKEMLNAKFSVEFEQLSLASAIKRIQDDFARTHRWMLPLPITIDGNALQRDGITKNQQVRNFSERERPLADVLTRLVRQANPFRDVKSPNDPNQRLVWVVAPDQQSILITTRSAAKQQSHDLPGVFLIP